VTGEDERLGPSAAGQEVRRGGDRHLHDESGVSGDPPGAAGVPQKIWRAEHYGIPPEDVLIDPLVLTVSTDHRAALVTLETIHLVKERLGVNLTCGASNVSYGLPWREAINMTFLSMAIGAGLSAAITNPLKPEIRQTVLAGDLLMGRDPYAANFISAFRAAQKQEG
jgi:5-methyltetrahydrofolate--homocysteine methyltransferase